MSMIRRGMQVPPHALLLACGLLLMASTSLPARADEGIVDVHSLPRLDGAEEDTSPVYSGSVRYRVPTAVPVTKAAAKKLFAANGWVPFVRPLDENNSGLVFKKGRQGLSLTLTQGLGRARWRGGRRRARSARLRLPEGAGHPEAWPRQ